MNINPYYGVVAAGGGSGASHFAGFPFAAAQCGPGPADVIGGPFVDGEFYAAKQAAAYHHHHHQPHQNGTVGGQLLKHHHPTASIANGNNNNNNNNSQNAALDATSSAAAYIAGRGGGECNGKLAPGYGPDIHAAAMHVGGSPIPGYGPPSYGTDHTRTYPGGEDQTGTMTPSPHRPSHQGLPSLAAARGQWSPSSGALGVSLGAKGGDGASSDPYKLSPPETAHHTTPTTPTHGYDSIDTVSAPMSSPPPQPASATRQLQQQQQQYSSPTVHQPTIPYYPWMGVVGT